MPYTSITKSEFRSLIASRLGDSIFFTLNEIDSYGAESLRTFNALAQYNRDKGLLQTISGTTFYDLPTSLDKNGIKILSYNIKDQDIFMDMKYSLMEDVSTINSWTGTTQFDLLQCQNAIEKARNEFLLRTNLVQSFSYIALGSAPIGIVELSDNIIEISRVSFLPNLQSYYIPLVKNDEYSSNSFNNGWNLNPNIPYSYSVISNPKNSIQLIPISQIGGRLNLITLNNGDNLDLTTGIYLNIPDDWTWAIKFKALFYLLSKDGEGTDRARADYCNQRFEESIIAAKASSTIINTYLNDSNLIPSTLNDMDSFNPSWQSDSILSKPTKIAAMGRNLIALNPVPDDIYSIAIDTIRNHPIPLANTDYMQVGKEYINPIVDYAVHLAMFKIGGSEFFSTMNLKDNLFNVAMENNLRLKAQSKSLEILRNISQKQEKEIPMYGKLAN